MGMNYKSFTKQVMNMRSGERVYINAINISENSFYVLRKMIQKGILYPDIDQVKTAYKKVDAVMSGDVILPQMDYIRK